MCTKYEITPLLKPLLLFSYYIQYLLGGRSFGSECDVFSFGVFLCDIITGKSSSQQSQHYLTYRKSRRGNIEDDADDCVDWGEGRCLKMLVKVALKCMRGSASDRPVRETLLS